MSKLGLVLVALCIRPQTAFRNGSDSCWVRYALPPEAGHERSICLPRIVWNEWLRQEVPAPLCGNWKGKWNAYSPPVNSSSEGPKRVLFGFSATELPAVSGLAGFAWRALHWLERIRERCDALLAPGDRFGIVRRLLLNARVPETPAGLLRSLGFVHLLAASGIHLYALATVVHEIFYAGLVLTVLSARGALISARAVSVAAWMIAWGLSGFRAGMLRPWIVVGLRSVAKATGLRWKLYAPLVIALGADLVIAAIRWQWAPGRWIYALAVGGGLMAGEGNPLALAIGSWLPVAIWDGFENGMIAIATPMLSVITIPLFALIIYPAAIISWLLFETGEHVGAAILADAVARVSTIVVSFLSKIVLSTQALWVIPRWGIAGGVILGCLACGLGLAKRRLRFRVCVALATGVCGFALSLFSHHDVRVEQLDVGQGDSALVLSDGGAGLIDTGSISALSDEGWLRLLAQRSVTQLDWIALTHLDADHVGGLHRFARLARIGCVAASRGEWESDRGAQLARMLASGGIRFGDWNTRCVPFPTLAPLASRKKTNANMGAIWIPLTKGGAYLSAGDAEGEDEVRIGKWAARLFALRGGRRLLKISHHGSTTSSSPEFLRLIDPTDAWISAGIGNHYGHPAPETIQLLNRLRIPVRRTDQQGWLE